MAEPTKRCGWCRTAIPENAAVCPKCSFKFPGYTQAVAAPGFARHKGLFIAAGVLVLYLALMGWSTGRTGDGITSRPSAVAPRAGAIPTSVPDRSQAHVVDPRQLAAGPREYLGANMVFLGEASNVQQEDAYTWIHLRARVPGRNLTESLVVEFRPKQAGILKQECYLIFGTGAGSQGTRFILTGATTDVPLVKGYAWESAAVKPYGRCVADW